MSDYLTSARERIETGWRIDYWPELFLERPWLVHNMFTGAVASFATHAEALQAYRDRTGKDTGK